jgi:hypothetical protein
MCTAVIADNSLVPEVRGRRFTAAAMPSLAELRLRQQRKTRASRPIPDLSVTAGLETCGYFARRRTSPANCPAVVIHENRGSIRISKMSRADSWQIGGLLPMRPPPAVIPAIMKLVAVRPTRCAKRTEDLVTAYSVLARPECGQVAPSVSSGNDRQHVCWDPDLAAGVPFMVAPNADVPKIKAPLMIHYAADEPSMPAGPPTRRR